MNWPSDRASAAPCPQPLSAAEQADIREAIEERSAIREHDGGEDRATAERNARSAMRVYRFRVTERPGTWSTMIAPGCNLDEARHALELRFGAERLVDVVLHEPEEESSR